MASWQRRNERSKEYYAAEEHVGTVRFDPELGAHYAWVFGVKVDKRFRSSDEAKAHVEMAVRAYADNLHKDLTATA